MPTFSSSAFPADWSLIAEPGPPFTQDAMHFPFPVSPLMASAFPAFTEGHLAGLHSLNIPEREYQVRVVNHYRFDRMLMEPPASDEAAAARAEMIERTLQREMGRMLDRWHNEHRPRLVALDERLRELRPRGGDVPSVLAMLDEADAIHREAWRIHFTIAPLMTLAMQLVYEMHADLFGEGDGALTLVAGSISESLKSAFGLADLAQRARELDLAATIRSTPADELPATLRASEAGRAFLSDFDAWLDAYGLRQDLFDFATPTWRENPAVALAAVRGYLETGHDPRVEQARTAQAAEAALQAARERLTAYPAAVREQFEQLVQLGRHGTFLQEEHNFYIDQRLLALLRLFYLEIGGHLSDLGLIDSADDVFMLRLDEIRELIAAPVPSGVHGRVAARREELARAARMVPPPMIGDAEGTPPPPDTPLTRSLAAFFGGPPTRAAATGEMVGTPGSRGIAKGPARVARTLEEARAVQPGEILIVVTTMPPWTPLFGIAAAVVTETGGPLSHCAVVAREYGIPAVVGAHGATTAIRTGQLVVVDGATGVVTTSS